MVRFHGEGSFAVLELRRSTRKSTKRTRPRLGRVQMTNEGEVSGRLLMLAEHTCPRSPYNLRGTFAQQPPWVKVPQ